MRINKYEIINPKKNCRLKKQTYSECINISPQFNAQIQ